MKVKINNFSGGLKLDRSENLVGFDSAINMQNYSVADGSISALNNISALTLNGWTSEEINQLLSGLNFSGGRVFMFKKYDFEQETRADKLVLFDSTHTGFYIDLYANELSLKELGITFLAPPSAINYRLNGVDVLLLVSESDHMAVWDGENMPEIVLDAPKIKSMDIHYERLFAISCGSDETSLQFSDDLDPTNWSESLSDAGFISMVDERGKLLKVLSFNDYLYVFREHGISRVYANTALTTMFYVNHLFTLGGRILKDTVSLVGSAVLFLTTDGFYLFDGIDTRKCLENIFPKISITGNEFATYFNGKYYLACHMDFNDDDDISCVNALVCVDISTMNVTVIKYNAIESMAVIDELNTSKLVVLTSFSDETLISIGETKEANPISLPCVWESAFSDFGDIGSQKIIRRVKVKLFNPQNSEVLLELGNERGERRLVKVSSTNKEVLLLFSGKRFKYKISSCAPDVKILALEFEIV